MADEKITELTELTTPVDADLISIVDDPAGTPVTKKVTVGNLLKVVYPVGSIYISTASTDPNTLFGFGTWAAFGAGRALVGLDSGDADFDVAEETGGAKTHTLTIAELPAHHHNFGPCGSSADGGTNPDLRSATDVTSKETADTGSGNAHNNVQPYIVVYMFKRTA